MAALSLHYTKLELIRREARASDFQLVAWICIYITFIFSSTSNPSIFKLFYDGQLCKPKWFHVVLVLNYCSKSFDLLSLKYLFLDFSAQIHEENVK